MAPDGPPRILVLSTRPDILADVVRAAAQLDPPVPVARLHGYLLRPTPDDLVIVDVAEPKVSPATLRSRFGSGPTLVALIEGAWASRLGDALIGGWDDYLFFPLNLDELGLLQRRHGAPREARELSLDVDEDGRLHLVIPSDVRYQRPAVERIVEAARHLGQLDTETVFRLRVSLGEAVANAILYGGGEGGEVVRIEAEVGSEGLQVRVRDEGPGFDPSKVPDPTVETGLEKSRGRGLFLLRQLCDDLRFNEAGNEVTLVYRGSLDPVSRVEPWLADFAALTGLRFRLERRRDAGVECVFDAWAAAGVAAPDPAELRTLDLGSGQALRLEYVPETGEGGADPARSVALLRGWLDVVAESEEARERLLDRRMRRARVLAELEVARDLQLRLLPSPESFDDLARVAARCEPALSLGGDFYYLGRLPGDRLGVMLGDVSSHGPSAALIMALTLSAASAVTHEEISPAKALDALREQLLSVLASTDMYMTLFYAVLDPGAGLSYANAGHPFAYRVSRGRAERLEALDPPLGMGAGQNRQERTIDWEPDDVLLAFTDGLAELSDPLEDERSKVRELIAEGEAEPDALVAALFSGSDDEMRLDDRTAVAVRR